MDEEAHEEVVATVYAVLTEFGIVRLRHENRLYAFGPHVRGAPRISDVRVGDRFLLTLHHRLNKVLEVSQEL